MNKGNLCKRNNFLGFLLFKKRTNFFAISSFSIVWVC